MRTTLPIDDHILASAQALAQLARRAFPVFPIPPPMPPPVRLRSRCRRPLATEYGSRRQLPRSRQITISAFLSRDANLLPPSPRPPTCPLTQLGFVRLSIQPAVVTVPLHFADALEALAYTVASPQPRFWPMETGLPAIPADIRLRIVGHHQLTHSTVLDLALRQGRGFYGHGTSPAFLPSIAHENLPHCAVPPQTVRMQQRIAPPPFLTSLQL